MRRTKPLSIDQFHTQMKMANVMLAVITAKDTSFPLIASVMIDCGFTDEQIRLACRIGDWNQKAVWEVVEKLTATKPERGWA